LFAALVGSPCLAQERIDAEAFCRKAGKNQAIYELSPAAAIAEGGAEAGAVTCRWTLGRTEGADVLVTLDSRVLKSATVARQTILLARLPENRQRKTVEPLPKMGDDGLSRATMEQGKLTLFEIEAVKGRRHFLLTVHARDGSGLTYRIADASISFLGAGIAALERP
jgi:hypothetical protein